MINVGDLPLSTDVYYSPSKDTTSQHEHRLVQPTCIEILPGVALLPSLSAFDARTHWGLRRNVSRTDQVFKEEKKNEQQDAGKPS